MPVSGPGLGRDQDLAHGVFRADADDPVVTAAGLSFIVLGA